MNFSFLILNYNSYGRTRSCINNLIHLKGDFNILVVDNSPPNKKFERLKNTFKKPNIYFISTGKNLGYSKGNNFGFNYFKEKKLIGEYVVILNNDVDVFQDFIINVSKTISKHSNPPVFSPRIIHKSTGLCQGPYKRDYIFKYFLEGIFPILGFIRVKTEQKKINSIKTFSKVFRTMGCCIIFQSKLFDDIGGFDENVFLGSEEEILAEKLIKIGLGFYYDPSYYVIHDHGYTVSKNKNLKSMFIESKIYYFKNYRGYNFFSLKVLEYSLYLREIWLNIILHVKQNFKFRY